MQGGKPTKLANMHLKAQKQMTSIGCNEDETKREKLELWKLWEEGL